MSWIQDFHHPHANGSPRKGEHFGSCARVLQLDLYVASVVWWAMAALLLIALWCEGGPWSIHPMSSVGDFMGFVKDQYGSLKRSSPSVLDEATGRFVQHGLSLAEHQVLPPSDSTLPQANVVSMERPLVVHSPPGASVRITFIQKAIPTKLAEGHQFCFSCHPGAWVAITKQGVAERSK